MKRLAAILITTTTTALAFALGAWVRWIKITVVCPRCSVRAVPFRAGRCGWCSVCGYAFQDIDRSML